MRTAALQNTSQRAMVAAGNVFTGDHFSPLAMTKVINEMPHEPKEMGKWFNWAIDESFSTDVSIEKETGQIYVLPITPRGGVLPQAKKPSRGAVKIEIPGFGEQDVILNSSLLGLRETGSVSLMQLETEREKSLRMIQRRILLTQEFARAQALRGLLVDADGTVVQDLCAILEKQQQEITIDLTAAGTDVNDELVAAKELAEDAMIGDFNVTGYKLVTGKRANRYLRTHGSVKDAFRDPINLVYLRKDNRDGIILADDVNVVSYGRGKVGDLIFLDEGADANYGVGYLVPEAEGFANTVYGPSDHEDFFGVPQEFYASREMLKHGKGVEIQGESFQLNYFADPSAIIRVKFKGK